jgi:hypothetical protein
MRSPTTKGQRSVVDHDTGRLVWAGQDRTEASVRRFFDGLAPSAPGGDSHLGRRSAVDPYRGRRAGPGSGAVPGRLPCRGLGYQGPTSHPRLRSEGIAPDGQHWSRTRGTRLACQVQPGTTSPPEPLIAAFPQGDDRPGQVQRSCIRWIALWSPLETRCLRPWWLDVRQLTMVGCTGNTGCSPSLPKVYLLGVAQGQGIDNLLSIGISQVPITS